MIQWSLFIVQRRQCRRLRSLNPDRPLNYHVEPIQSYGRFKAWLTKFRINHRLENCVVAICLSRERICSYVHSSCVLASPPPTTPSFFDHNCRTAGRCGRWEQLQRRQFQWEPPVFKRRNRVRATSRHLTLFTDHVTK